MKNLDPDLIVRGFSKNCRSNYKLKNLLKANYPARIFSDQDVKVGIGYEYYSLPKLIFSFKEFNSIKIPLYKISPLLFACLDTVVYNGFETSFGSCSTDITSYPESLVLNCSEFISTINPNTLLNPPKQKILDVFLRYFHDNKIKSMVIQHLENHFKISFQSLRSWDKGFQAEIVLQKNEKLEHLASQLLLSGRFLKSEKLQELYLE